MDKTLEQKLANAVWAAKSLFDRGKTSGSSANLSFLHKEQMYITKSGSCFGSLAKDQFAVMDMKGNCLSSHKPSKEWPLHLQIYQNKPSVGAVIHTHGTYSVLWSFVPTENENDCIPAHTPYLKMKLGTVCTIPYLQPGSQELFDAFGKRVLNGDGYLLKQHGAVVPGKDILDAFYCLEELEESARIAWELYSHALH